MYNEVMKMTDEEARNALSVIDNNLKILLNEEFRLEKKKRKGLRWWFLLPLFGFIVYLQLVSRRGNDPKYSEPLTKVKSDIMAHEFKKMMLKKKLGELDNEKN